MIHSQDVNILKQIYEQNRKKPLIQIERFYVALYDENNSLIEFPCLIEKDQELELGETKKQRNYKGINALPDYVIATKKALRIADFDTWLAKDGIPTYEDFEGVPRSWMGIPLFIGDKVIGVIVVENTMNNNAYGRDEERLLATMAGQVSTALYNARAYRRLRELNTEIAKREELITKTLIASDFLHRINNLAGTIPLWIDLMREELFPSDPRDERLTEYLSEIETEVRNLLNRAAEFKKPIQEENINIKDLLEAILDHVGIQYSNIVCRQSLTPNLYLVKANYFQISSVIDSLITNAVESMLTTGGTLTINAINIDNPNGKKAIEIQIKDTGVGIAKEKITEVFEAFYTTKGPERGYGLWRSKSYIEGIGGTIQLVSEINIGTTVAIVLPAVSS